jgi:hypothetical protein
MIDVPYHSKVATWCPRCVSCKQDTQDMCTVNEVRKYHCMCETVDSVYVAVETQQRIFC